MDDDVEEKEITKHGSNQAGSGNIDDLVAALFGFVEGADVLLGAKVLDE
jgi:hypothetical protein